jgi:hypothetical protein
MTGRTAAAAATTTRYTPVPAIAEFHEPHRGSVARRSRTPPSAAATEMTIIRKYKPDRWPMVSG